ncbi:MAG: hypothetical protein NVSMB2_19690 [Chloroflexota bacterium]
MLSGSAEVWGWLGDRDARSARLRTVDGKPISYADLLARAPAHVAEQISPEVFRAKNARVQTALAALVTRLAHARPDVIVFMGDDEEEYIHDDLRPALLIYRGAAWRNQPRPPDPADRISVATSWQWGRQAATYPVASELAEHVLQYLIDAEFDVGDSLTLEAMPHGFGFLYERLLGDKLVPLVPIIINVHTPPAQPTPRRCFMLGRAVRDALLAWRPAQRVAIVATGGLSVGVLDESLDRALLQALASDDLDALARLPRAWMQGSTGEVLCWIAAAGALEHLSMEVVDYVPGYRSSAGTGTGLAFATWT